STTVEIRAMRSSFRAKIASLPICGPDVGLVRQPDGQVRRTVPRVATLRWTWSMRPAPAALRGKEVHEAATNGTTFAVFELARAMRWSGPANEEPHSPDTRHPLHITL